MNSLLILALALLVGIASGQNSAAALHKAALDAAPDPCQVILPGCLVFGLLPVV